MVSFSFPTLPSKNLIREKVTGTVSHFAFASAFIEGLFIGLKIYILRNI